jgi:hypothetical protein
MSARWSSTKGKGREIHPTTRGDQDFSFPTDSMRYLKGRVLKKTVQTSEHQSCAWISSRETCSTSKVQQHVWLAVSCTITRHGYASLIIRAYDTRDVNYFVGPDLLLGRYQQGNNAVIKIYCGPITSSLCATWSSDSSCMT